MSRKSRTALVTLALCLTLAGCKPKASEPANTPLPFPAFAPLGEPLGDATEDQLRSFERGRQVALKRFAPSQGLGPLFNVTACGACHEKPTLGGSAGRYRDFLLSLIHI